MSTVLVKVPLGPEFVLYEGEFFAMIRHRIMLFFYFGLLCAVLVTSRGPHTEPTEAELLIGLVAVEVFVGVLTLLACTRLSLWRAKRRNVVARVRMCGLIALAVASALFTAELLEPYFIGTPRSTALTLALKLMFYVVLTELMVSAMLQYTLGYMLQDLRKDRTVSAPAPAPDRQA